MLNKQVVVIDEVVLNGLSQINTLKSFTNDTLFIEQKGKDGFSAKNHATLFFLSNRLDALGEFKNDRRVSIYGLTDVPLKFAENLLKDYGGGEVELRYELLAKADRLIGPDGQVSLKAVRANLLLLHDDIKQPSFHTIAKVLRAERCDKGHKVFNVGSGESATTLVGRAKNSSQP